MAEWLATVSWVFKIANLLSWVKKGLGLMRKLEIFEKARVAGGAIGAALLLLFVVTDPASNAEHLKPGPFVCFMLFGAVFGTRRYRATGLAVGAILSIAVHLVLLPEFRPDSWPGGQVRGLDWLEEPEKFLADWLWLFVSFVPLGSLVAGDISDRLARATAESKATAESSGDGPSSHP